MDPTIVCDICGAVTLPQNLQHCKGCHCDVCAKCEISARHIRVCERGVDDYYMELARAAAAEDADDEFWLEHGYRRTFRL